MSQDQITRYRSRMTVTNLWPAAHSASDAEVQLLGTADPAADVLTWAGINRHPMDDMLAAWLVLGLITEAQATATSEARDRATATFLAEYRAVHVDRPQSAEELAELRAAFGPGTSVVNVVTGRHVNL